MCKIIWWNIALPVRPYSCQIYILNAHFLYVSCNYGSWMIKNITTLVAYALDVNITPSKRKQLEKSIVNGPNTWWIFTRQAATKAVQHNYAVRYRHIHIVSVSTGFNTIFCEDEHQEVLTWFPTQTTVLIVVPLQRSIRKAFRTAKGTWKRVTALHKIASNPSIC